MFLLNKKVAEGTSSKHIPPFYFSFMMQKLSFKKNAKPSLHLLILNEQWKYKNNMKILFRPNNEDT